MHRFSARKRKRTASNNKCLFKILAPYTIGSPKRTNNNTVKAHSQRAGEKVTDLWQNLKKHQISYGFVEENIGKRSVSMCYASSYIQYISILYSVFYSIPSRNNRGGEFYTPLCSVR